MLALLYGPLAAPGVYGDRDMVALLPHSYFKGYMHLIFCSLSKCPQSYPELLNLLEEADGSVEVTSWRERILGCLLTPPVSPSYADLSPASEEMHL